MNYTKKLISAAALGFALASASLSAQSASGSEYSLLGKRYAGVDIFVDDARDFDDNGYGPALTVNLPVSSSVDFNASLGYEDFNSKTVDFTNTYLEIGGTIYNRQEGYSPYVTATLGHGWTNWEIASVETDTDSTYYGAGVGVEVPFTAVNEKTFVNLSINFYDNLERWTDSIWTFKGSLHYWVTPQIAVKGSVEVIEDDATVLSIGARFAF